MGGESLSSQVSPNQNPHAPNGIPKCYKYGENEHKSNINLKCGTTNFIDSIEEEIKYEETENEGELEDKFIEFDIGGVLSHSLVVR